MVYTTGTARIRHADTGAIFEIDADELDWSADNGEDREMGPEIFHTAAIDHPNLGHLSWLVAEYPVGVENMKETDAGRHTVVQDFDYGLSADPPESGEEQHAQVEELVTWFLERYEDPANSLPYVSAEGGYQWLEGGPHDAGEVLRDNFSDVNEAVIEAAVEQIEADGLTEWAAQRSADDYDDYEPPADANHEDAALDDLDVGPLDVGALIAQIPLQAPGIRFEVVPQGPIRIAPALISASDLQGVADLVEECLVAVDQLLAALAGTNAYPDLLAEVGRYGDLLRGPNLAIPRIFAVGIRIENLRAEIAMSSQSGERPELPSAASSRLTSALQIHATIIAGTQEGRVLIENARFYAETAVASAALQQQSRELSQALISAPGLLDADAQHVVASANRDIGRGPLPDRSVGHAVSTTNNLLKVITRIGLSFFGFIALESVGASGAGTAAIHAGGGIVDATIQTVGPAAAAAWSFMERHLELIRSYAALVGSQLGWLSSICDQVRVHLRLRRR